AQAVAAIKANAIWEAGIACETHPYLTKKGVASYGLRTGSWEQICRETGDVVIHEGVLLLPIQDCKNEVCSVQAIHPKSFKKIYLEDGKKQGNFFPIGKALKHFDDRLIYILVEGYATGASVHEATGQMVLVCFDSSNLKAVALALREARPNAIIILAADND